MLRIFLMMLIFSSCTLTSFSQADKTTLQNQQKQTDKKVREALVKMAMKNPSYKLLNYEQADAEYNVTIAKANWLQNFFVAGNLNEYNISKGDNGPSLYPRYNVGVRFNFGDFIAIPTNIKKSKNQLEAISVQKEKLALSIREEVLTAYENYIMNKDLYNLQYNLAEEDRILYGKAETDFAANKIQLTEYNIIYRSYNNSQADLITAKRNLAISGIVLENMIGMPVEDALLKLTK